MTNNKREYDTTVARIAGNIAPALLPYFTTYSSDMADSFYIDVTSIAHKAVDIARALVEEVKRTESEHQP